MKRKRQAEPSFARLDVWARGEIWGLHSAGIKREEICTRVVKVDGTPPSLNAVDMVIAHKADNPQWRGAVGQSSGRPQSLSEAQKKLVLGLVFEERGRAKVTVKYCKQMLRFLRKLSRKTVERALEEAGLAWLRRRTKRLVPRDAKPGRIAYSNWVLKRHQGTLDRFAYTDGTTFYLARGLSEHEDKQRAALGTHVWRMSNGKAGLWEENVGPSLYAKAQGTPVKIWGFFANGRLEYYVLPKDGARTTNMNGDRYEWLVANKVPMWRRACFEDDEPVHLVQDHEKCLWQERNLLALRRAGCPVVACYPNQSPDLNAIEGWWKVLRDRPDLTAPEEIESREEFVTRLRRTVAWLNINDREHAVALARNQKVRARAVLHQEGARTKW